MTCKSGPIYGTMPHTTDSSSHNPNNFAMATLLLERLREMKWRLQRHVPKSWPVTLSWLAEAPIVCAFSRQRVAGTQVPRISCILRLPHCSSSCGSSCGRSPAHQLWRYPLHLKMPPRRLLMRGTVAIARLRAHLAPYQAIRPKCPAATDLCACTARSWACCRVHGLASSVTHTTYRFRKEGHTTNAEQCKTSFACTGCTIRMLCVPGHPLASKLKLALLRAA